jgi:hypothetical protein
VLVQSGNGKKKCSELQRTKGEKEQREKEKAFVTEEASSRRTRSPRRGHGSGAGAAAPRRSGKRFPGRLAGGWLVLVCYERKVLLAGLF